jgi:hypothetical protein
MRKITLTILAIISLWLAGCPHNNPTAQSVGVTVTLPTAGVNCVTVNRNPKTNEVETLSCTDSVNVTSTLHAAVAVTETVAPSDVVTITTLKQFSAALVETQTLVDVARINRGLKVSLVETSVTVDTFTCPAKLNAAVVENGVTADTLTCGGT